MSTNQITKGYPYSETEQFTVHPFQRDDLNAIHDRDWSANWSQMGAYKTTTVEWLIERKLKDLDHPARVLVVTTKAGKGTYYQTIPEVLKDWTVYNATTNGLKLVLGEKEIPVPGIVKDKPAIILTHYQVMAKRKKGVKGPDGEWLKNSKGKKLMVEVQNTMCHKLQEMHWDFVVLDEAHRIKERKTNWTREIKKLKATYRHIMTGTGFINDPSEVWSLLNFLSRKTFPSYWMFRNTYCDEYIDDAGFIRIIGIRDEKKDEFRELIRAVGPRRLKVDIFPDLKEPIFTPVKVELNPTQRKIYNEIRDYLQSLDQAGTPIYSPNVLSALQRLRQVCVATPEVVEDYFDEVEQRRKQKIKLVEPSSKLDALMEIIEGLEWDEERKDQIVVFSNFKDPIELAKKRFDEAGITYIHMKQGDSDRVRYEKWAKQFPLKEHQVFISTLQLGSESISLTPATTVVFLDRSWSPKDNQQGIERVWRPDQRDNASREPADVINIDAIQTVDNRVLAANVRKTKWFTAIFGKDTDE